MSQNAQTPTNNAELLRYTLQLVATGEGEAAFEFERFPGDPILIVACDHGLPRGRVLYRITPQDWRRYIDSARTDGPLDWQKLAKCGF